MTLSALLFDKDGTLFDFATTDNQVNKHSKSTLYLVIPTFIFSQRLF